MVSKWVRKQVGFTWWGNGGTVGTQGIWTLYGQRSLPGPRGKSFWLLAMAYAIEYACNIWETNLQTTIWTGILFHGFVVCEVNGSPKHDGISPSFRDLQGYKAPVLWKITVMDKSPDGACFTLCVQPLSRVQMRPRWKNWFAWRCATLWSVRWLSWM